MSLCELTRATIQELIPHRDPFLFLASASIESDKEISGFAVWSKDHPILQGHFPQKPVVPGICLVEAGAQLAGVLLHWQNRNAPTPQGTLGVLGSIQRAKFRRPVMADEILTLHCKIRALNPSAYWVHSIGKIGKNHICESELLIAQASPKKWQAFNQSAT